MRLDRYGFLMSLVVLAAASLAASALFLGGVREGEPAPFVDVPGDAESGRLAIERHGCGACHTIEGVRGARGRVAPTLHDLRRQRFIAGRLPNTPENLARFIMDPQGVSPGSAMPDMLVADVEARDMAAYLYAIGGR